MTLRNITKQVIAFLLVLFVCIGVVMGGQGNLSASAASEMQAAFEERNVMDDLTGGTVGGNGRPHRRRSRSGRLASVCQLSHGDFRAHARQRARHFRQGTHGRAL